MTLLPRGRSGVSHILALLLLCVFSSLGLTLANFASADLAKTHNLRAASSALLAAESGMNFMNGVLATIRLPGRTTQETFLPNLCDALARRLNGTPNLGTQTVQADSTCVYVPPISLGGVQFRCWIGYVAANRARLTIRGESGGVSRNLAIDYNMVRKLAGVFDYGLASKGKVTIGGSSRIIGINNPQEANVLSATQLTLESILVSGSNVTISGDLFAAGADTYVSLIGTPTIAGSRDPVVVAEHLHFGVEPPDFPQMATESLRSLATSVIDSKTKTSGGVFNNARILANTNPNFTADTVINGILFIEQPNQVKFAGHTSINGLIITAEGGNPATCSVDFGGTVDARGVAALPDTPQFHAVKQETGTFLAAPGFAAKFTGTFSAISGSVAAADQITFSGTAEGVIKGCVIGLQDIPTTVIGHVDIFVDRSRMDPDPAGFVQSYAFVVDSDSYQE